MRRRARESPLVIAVAAHDFHRLLLRELLCLARVIRAAVIRVRTLVPLDLQPRGGLVGLPPGVGHDRDAVQQTHLHPDERALARIRRADDQHLPDTRHRFHFVEIGTDKLATVHRAFLEHGVQHPRDGRVDTEDRFARHNERTVDAAERLPDDAKILRVFQRNRLEIRRRYGSRLAKPTRRISMSGHSACGARHRVSYRTR